MAGMQKPNKEKVSDEIVIDAYGKKLGRLASEAARLLLGKGSPDFRRNVAKNVKIIVQNAAQLDISARAASQKYHTRYSGFPSGLKREPIKKVIAKKGYREVIRHAVYGMLPANKLRKIRMKNLVVREGE